MEITGRIFFPQTFSVGLYRKVSAIFKKFITPSSNDREMLFSDICFPYHDFFQISLKKFRLVFLCFVAVREYALMPEERIDSSKFLRRNPHRPPGSAVRRPPTFRSDPRPPCTLSPLLSAANAYFSADFHKFIKTGSEPFWLKILV